MIDSSYPRRGTDPWYATSGEAFRLALEKVSPGSVARLGDLLDRVRAAPITGRTRDADGSALQVRVDPRALADLVQATGSDPLTLRELDASMHAALAGDDVPLLRLTGQAGTWNFSPSEADYFSRGAYLAVNCTDLPQLFDLDASPRARRAQLAAAVAPDGAFAPFTGAEWSTISGFSQPYDVCLDWPKPCKRPPRLPATRLPASVPILIVGGDLDSLTPLLDAPVFGPKMGENVEIVPLRNTVHVTSQGGDFLTYGKACARTVIRSFLRGTPDSACTATIPALHTPDYLVTPATLVSGPDPGEAARRAATIGVQAFADAVFRRYYSGVDRGPGLRGGTFTAQRRRLHAARHPLHPRRHRQRHRPLGRLDRRRAGGPDGRRREADRRVDAADPAGHRADRRRRTLHPGTLMDTFLAIASRREVRTYDGRPLPEDAVRRILEAGRLAGSSKNRQQRHFVVLRDHEAVASAVWNPDNIRGAALVVAIVVSGKGPLALDAGRAAQNMLLAAHNEGIGGCPNGLANPDALDIGDVATILSFGYPARPSDPERRIAEEWIERADRKPFDDVVSER